MTNNVPALDWLTCSQPNAQAQIRLFCLPYAGGGASIYHVWSAPLWPDIEVWSIRLPGRENRLLEPCFTRLDPLIDALAPELLTYLDRPFAIFGHSMGAIIAYELVQTLRQRYAKEPIHLFVSGRAAPHLPRSTPPIHHLPEVEFLIELEQLNGMRTEILKNDELMKLLLPTLRADFTLSETYEFVVREPLDCPISAFGGLQDAKVTREEVEAWKEHTRGSFSFRMFPGDHFFLHTDQELLLRAICHDLLLPS